MAQSSDVRQQSCSPPPTRDTSEIMTDELPPSRANLEVRADLTEPANKVTEAGLDVVSSVRNVGLLFGELTGIGVDAIRAWRERNAFRLRCRMEEIRSERSVNQQRNLNPKDASKMLAAATIEEDDRLAEMWAQLIVSARDPARSPLDMAVVDAFQAFTRLDAEVLVALAAAETAAVQQRAVDIGSKFEEERRKAIGAANERTTLERLAAARPRVSDAPHTEGSMQRSSRRGSKLLSSMSISLSASCDNSDALRLAPATPQPRGGRFVSLVSWRSRGTASRRSAASCSSEFRPRPSKTGKAAPFRLRVVARPIGRGGFGFTGRVGRTPMDGGHGARRLALATASGEVRRAGAGRCHAPRP